MNDKYSLELNNISLISNMNELEKHRIEVALNCINNLINKYDSNLEMEIIIKTKKVIKQENKENWAFISENHRNKLIPLDYIFDINDNLNNFYKEKFNGYYYKVNIIDDKKYFLDKDFNLMYVYKMVKKYNYSTSGRLNDIKAVVVLGNKLFDIRD